MRYWFSLICLISLACQSSALAPMKEAATESKPTAPPTMPTPSPETTVRAVCAELLHVRTEPMGEVRGWLEDGQKVRVYLPVDGWSQIAAGKWRGLWVRESWLCE